MLHRDIAGIQYRDSIVQRAVGAGRSLLNTHAHIRVLAARGCRLPNAKPARQQNCERARSYELPKPLQPLHDVPPLRHIAMSIFSALSSDISVHSRRFALGASYNADIAIHIPERIIKSG